MASPPPAPAAPSARPDLARAAGLISAATLLSRLLGLVREQVFAALLGASHFADAFQVAFRVPNLLRDLFAEGALSSAFVPTFTDRLRNQSAADAYALADRVAAFLTVLLAALVALGVAFAPQIVGLMAGEYAHVPGKLELTTTLTRVMLPFLPLVSLAAVAMGMLNAQERYGAPAVAPAMFNVVAITVGVTLWAAGLPPRTVALGWAAGVLAGGAAQLAVQLVPLLRAGYRPRPSLDLRLRDPGLRRVLSLMAPATVGLAATQVNIFVNTWFASHQAGAVSWLSYAFRLMYLPIGVFGVAAATVATTRIAQRVAAGDGEGTAAVLREGLRAVAATTVPATVGLVVLAAPIVRLLYERGRFDAADTNATAAALAWYALGLYTYAAVKVLAPAFVALGRPRVPMLASMAAVAANLLLNVLLYPLLGFRGLALGTSVAAITNVVVLAVVFERSHGGLLRRELAGHFGRVLLGSAATGAAAYGAWRGVELLLGPGGLAARLAAVLLPCTAGVGTYAVACRVLGIPELAEVVSRVTRRLGRRR